MAVFAVGALDVAAFTGAAFDAAVVLVAAVAVLAVAGFAGAVFAVVRAASREATVVLAASLAAAATRTVVAFVAAALAPADRAPVTATAAAFTAAERAGLGAERADRPAADRAGAAAVERVVVRRWLGTAEDEASARWRPAGRSARAVDTGPRAGPDPSEEEGCGWSGLIHLTSVDRHDNAFPGRGAGSM